MANHFLNGRFLNIESRGIALPAAIMALSSAASSLLAVWRDWLLAERFGAGADLDVYYAAFRIPDLIYNILVFGGITVAFLPLFSDYYSKDRQAAWRFAANTLNIFLAFLVILSAGFFVFAPQVMRLVVPGFSLEQLEKTVNLSRLMFLSPIIFGAAAVFSGILQYFKKFVAYSLAPLFYNLGIIAGIFFLVPVFGIFGVAAGVIFGALLYLLIQILPAFRCGFKLGPVFDLRDHSLKRVFKLMLPRTAGIAANQINLIAPTFIGSSLAAGSIAIFNLAGNVCSLPAGIIGVSFATAAFAAFSKYYAQGRIDELARKFSETFRQISYLALPAAAAVFILRRPIVGFLYEHGRFSESDALLTAAALGLFSLGVYFSVMMPVVFRLFFSLRDTVSPTLTTIFSVGINIFLNYLLVLEFNAGPLSGWARRTFGLSGVADISVLGLALAYSIANALQFILLTALLYGKNGNLVRLREIASSFVRSAAAGIFMALALYLLIGALPLPPLPVLAVSGLAGAVIYFSATFFLGSPEIIYAKQILTDKWKHKKSTNQK